LGILLAAVFAPIVLLVVICVIIKTCRWKRPPLSAPTTETASHTSSGFQMETRPPPTAPLTAMIYLRRTLLVLTEAAKRQTLQDRAQLVDTKTMFLFTPDIGDGDCL